MLDTRYYLFDQNPKSHTGGQKNPAIIEKGEME